MQNFSTAKPAEIYQLKLLIIITDQNSTAPFNFIFADSKWLDFELTSQR